MAEQMRQGFCQECSSYTLVKRRGVSHVLHLLLSLFTIGLWVFVWIALALLNVGGWRCQTCGSDKIKDTGEMLSVRGWLIIFVTALIIFPMVVLFSGGPDAGSTMNALAPLLMWVPIVAIPVLVVLAVRRRSRQRERISSRKVEVPQPTASPREASDPAPGPERREPTMPPGMTVSEEYFERAEADTSAADEFRRRMERRQD